jgi:undecaprenyl-diphosphatase
VVQGLTEFLPVSSSGHLVIAQELFTIKPEGIVLEVALHLATLVAVMIFLRKHIWKLLKKLISKDEAGYGWMYILGIMIATIPAGIVGLFFEEKIELFFEDVTYVGVFLIITGIIVILIPRLYRDEGKEFTWKNIFLLSLIVGIFQAFAILPGVSRSGSTIFAGVLMGLSWKKSADFSFTISIPAIIGAGMLEGVKIFKCGVDFSILNISLSFISALITGIFALWLLYIVLKKGNVFYFGIYCFIVGIAVLIYNVF